MKNKLNIIAALDSFKGSLSSADAGEAVRRGILARYPDAQVTVFPVGDGGEGTAEALCLCHHAERHRITVTDTHGSPVTAEYGTAVVNGVRTAFLDMAAAAGIRYAEAHGLDLLRSSTFGVGECIRAILSDGGCGEIVMGLGGSGTNDGGIGALSALGGRFFRRDGSKIEMPVTASLFELASCDLSVAKALLQETKLTLLYDSGVPLIGPTGATELYSRQKGASEELIPKLETAMIRYAGVCNSEAARMPGAGAAGGLGYGLSLIGGKLTPGADAVLSSIGFREAASQADAIFTGEGKTDRQTATGKLPLIVARHALGKPVICLCGMAQPVAELYEAGIDAVFAIADGPMTFEESMAHTAQLLEKAAFQFAGLLAKTL